MRIFFWIVTFIIVGFVSCQNRTDVESLYNVLLSNYDAEIPPEYGPITVYTTFYLASINGFDEVTGTFATVNSLHLSWYDYRMKWDSSQYNGLNVIRISDSKVWFPRMIVKNPVKRMTSFGLTNNVVRYENTGSASWSSGEFLETSCDFDVTHFPFDKQTCDIQYIPWMYTTSEILLIPTSDQINMTLYSENGMWDLESTSVKTYITGSQPWMAYSVQIVRRSEFFVLTIFLPVLTLLLLNSVVFLLPTDSGERTGYAITCLLALAVFLTLTSDSLPKSSSPLSVLSCLLMLLVLVSASICLMVIISLWLHHKDENSKPPSFIQKFTYYCKNVCKCCKANPAQSVTKDEEKRELNSKKQLTKPDDLHSVVVKRNQKSKGTDEHRISSKISLRHIKVRTQDDVVKEKSEEKEKKVEPFSDVTWKMFSELFNFLCFVSTISFTGAVGFIYVLIAGGNL